MDNFDDVKGIRNIREYTYFKISDDICIFSVFIFTEPVKTYISESTNDFDDIRIALEDNGFIFIESDNCKPINCIERSHVRNAKMTIYGSTINNKNQLNLNGLLSITHPNNMKFTGKEHTFTTLYDLEKYTFGNQSPENILEMTKIIKNNFYEKFGG